MSYPALLVSSIFCHTMKIRTLNTRRTRANCPPRLTLIQEDGKVEWKPTHKMHKDQFSMQSRAGNGARSLGETGRARADFVVCGEGCRERHSFPSCQEAWQVLLPRVQTLHPYAPLFPRRMWNQKWCTVKGMQHFQESFQGKAKHVHLIRTHILLFQRHLEE